MDTDVHSIFCLLKDININFNHSICGQTEHALHVGTGFYIGAHWKSHECSPWAGEKICSGIKREWSEKQERETEGIEESSFQEPIRQQLFSQKMRLFLIVTVKWFAINSSWGNAPLMVKDCQVLQAHIYWFTLLVIFFSPGCLLADLNGRRDRPTWLGTILRDPRLEVGMGKVVAPWAHKGS